MSENFEPMADLDVMNNYMFNKLTSDSQIAEPTVRLMIETLLGITLGDITVKAESIIVPDSPQHRGVRLDVEVNEIDKSGQVLQKFDLEPHRQKETNYPKINRYRQAQLDKNAIERGSNDFKHLPKLFIITITNYDLFGADHMVYTVKKSFVEAPKLSYNDDVTIIYFNTSGKYCNNKKIKNFLKYLEDSRSENVVDETTKKIDEYVNYVRQLYGGDYVTVGDWIDGMFDEKYGHLLAEKLAEKDASNAAILAEKLAEKDEEIARLRAELDKYKNE